MQHDEDFNLNRCVDHRSDQRGFKDPREEMEHQGEEAGLSSAEGRNY